MRSVILVLILLCPVSGAAQTAQPAAQAPTPRMDLAGSAGWLHVPFELRSSDFFRDTDWTHHATATATAGFYWTDHWKTEMSIALSNTARAWDAEFLQQGAVVTQRSVEHHVRYTEFTLGQFYQFRRNEWVHPSVGAGLLLQQRRGHSDYSPGYVYRTPSGPPVTMVPAERRDLADEVRAAPFVAVALKAYLTPRAFFRTDVQVAFSRNVESVVMHAGFGVDF